MLKRVKQFLKPPIFADDEDKTQTARTLYALLANMVLVLIICTAATIFIFLNKIVASIIILILLATTIGSATLAQRGLVRPACKLFMIVVWIVFTLWHLLVGKISTSAVSIHIAAAVMAGVLLGKYAAVIAAALSSTVALVIAILEIAGRPLIPYLSDSPLPSIVVFLLSCLWTITPLYLTIEGSARALSQARKSEKKYRLLAENSTDMISSHTPEGVYLYASPSSLLLLGYIPTIEEAEYFLVQEAMKKTGNNQVLAAQLLGITRQTLKTKLDSSKGC